MGTRWSERRTRRTALIGVALGLALTVAACGSDDDEGASTEAPAATDAAATTAGGAAPTTELAAGTEPADTEATTAPDATEATTDGSDGAAGSAGCPEIDESLDETAGVGAGRFASDVQCALDAPLAAEGEPVRIGFQVPEGDPAGSFPESTNGALAAVEFINTELGGLGSDLQNGVPGGPSSWSCARWRSRPTTRSAAPTSWWPRTPSSSSRASTSSATTCRSTRRRASPASS